MSKVSMSDVQDALDFENEVMSDLEKDQEHRESNEFNIVIEDEIEPFDDWGYLDYRNDEFIYSDDCHSDLFT